jgi:hypothetical protein
MRIGQRSWMRFNRGVVLGRYVAIVARSARPMIEGSFDTFNLSRCGAIRCSSYMQCVVILRVKTSHLLLLVEVEEIPWADGKNQTTYTFRVFLVTWAKRLSWKETGCILGDSWDTVFRAIQWIVHWGTAHREIAEITAIDVDEIQYRRGHSYLTMVYQIDQDCRRLLYVAYERTKASLRRFFNVMTEQTLQSMMCLLRYADALSERYQREGTIRDSHP